MDRLLTHSWRTCHCVGDKKVTTTDYLLISGARLGAAGMAALIDFVPAGIWTVFHLAWCVIDCDRLLVVRLDDCCHRQPEGVIHYLRRPERVERQLKIFLNRRGDWCNDAIVHPGFDHARLVKRSHDLTVAHVLSYSLMIFRRMTHSQWLSHLFRRWALRFQAIRVPLISPVKLL